MWKRVLNFTDKLYCSCHPHCSHGSHIVHMSPLSSTRYKKTHLCWVVETSTAITVIYHFTYIALCCQHQTTQQCRQQTADNPIVLTKNSRQLNITDNKQQWHWYLTGNTPALSGQRPLPEHTVGSTASHGSQEVWVDLNHFLHCLRLCPQKIISHIKVVSPTNQPYCLIWHNKYVILIYTAH